MTLESQVCTFEQSIRLRELGVVQQGYWYWGDRHAPHLDLLPKDQWDKKDDIFNAFWYTAFTVSELGVMLPDRFKFLFSDVKITYSKCGVDSFGVFLMQQPDDIHIINFKVSHHEAHVRAEMLIHLLEKDMIKVEQVNERLINS